MEQLAVMRQTENVRERRSLLSPALAVYHTLFQTVLYLAKLPLPYETKVYGDDDGRPGLPGLGHSG